MVKLCLKILFTPPPPINEQIVGNIQNMGPCKSRVNWKAVIYQFDNKDDLF